VTKRIPKAKSTVLVTGVSSGIGLTLAEDLLEHGYEVLGSVRKIQDADELCARWSGSFTPLVFDVTDAAALPGIATQVQTIVGGRGLKALVNNAGISLSGPLMHQPLSELRKVFDVNLFGTLAVTQTFLPLLGAHCDRIGAPGRVVNIGSIADYRVWLEQFDRAVTFQEQNAPPAVKVAEAVRHAIESRKPRTRYPLDPLWNVARRMPDEKFDRLIFNALGIDGEVSSGHEIGARSQHGEV
jgi:NAD(P)-dependent dehydrogenase (short-subunit alcohol dehydrogenase family)